MMMRFAIPWATIFAGLIVSAILISWGFILIQARAELVDQIQTLNFTWDNFDSAEYRVVEEVNEQPAIALTDTFYLNER